MKKPDKKEELKTVDINLMLYSDVVDPSIIKGEKKTKESREERKETKDVDESIAKSTLT